VTIACGACSGFHGLVCSGTTSKQIEKEKHCKPVGYGAMLCEGFVAFIALVTIMKATDAQIAGLKPGTIYGNGIGDFLTLIVGERNRHYAITFGAMAFSTFVFDTLDVSTRLGRYLIQEMLSFRGRAGALLGTLATVSIPAVFIYGATEGSFMKFWFLFGSSNQLLAALTLLSITVWLYQARRRIAFTLIPMVFVLVTTLVSLVQLGLGNLFPGEGKSANLMQVANAISAFALIGLALYLVFCALLKIRGERGGETVLAPTNN
jgi:carbon starvation protein